jgi:hypothetical protein
MRRNHKNKIVKQQKFASSAKDSKKVEKGKPRIVVVHGFLVS